MNTRDDLMYRTASDDRFQWWHSRFSEASRRPSDIRSDGRFVSVNSEADVESQYRGTPIEHLLMAQNLGAAFPVGPTPSLLVATCIDSRVRLQLPPGAAYELRSAGVNLERHAIFQIAYALSVARVGHIAVISHEDCEMSQLESKRDAFVEGLVEQHDWDPITAGLFFEGNQPLWRRDDPLASVNGFAKKLRERFSGLLVAPLHYCVREHKLYQVREGIQEFESAERVAPGSGGRTGKRLTTDVAPVGV